MDVDARRFITLEGGEGVGKSTQRAALAARLRATGERVVETREPGGSEGAEAIRRLLLEGEAQRWSARTEALLFAAARADHVERLIRPALARGDWVISDRFVDSSRAYQSASGIADDALLALHDFGSKGFLPIRTLILTLAHDEALARAQARDHAGGDRIGERGAAYHTAVTEAFIRLADQDPERFRLINASGTPEVVTDRLMAVLADLLP